MTVKTNKLSLGKNGSYSEIVEVGTDDGLNLYFKDQSTAGVKKTLSNLWGTVPTHPIDSHSGMSGDFATQYYNQARLDARLALAAVGNLVGISGDVDGKTTVGQHVSNNDVHQRVPKYTLRVAKGGQNYTTISDALAAIPTSGADAPSSSQWWRIEVWPGTYNESVRLDKRFVEIIGGGLQSTRVTFDNTSEPTMWALEIAASDVRVVGIEFTTSKSTSGENRVVQIGDTAGAQTFTSIRIERCRMLAGSGYYPINISTGASVYFEECLLAAALGVAVKQAGLATYDRCQLLGSASIGGCVEASNTTTVDLINCYFFGAVALKLTSCTARVFSARRGTGIGSAVSLANGTSSTNSTIYWDGTGLTGEFGADGTLTVELWGAMSITDWGDLTGDLADQGDLADALNARLPATIASPRAGQVIWYNGTTWVNGPRVTTSATEPTDPADGDIWFDMSEA